MSAQKKESWITVIFVQDKKESIPVYLGNSYFRALILHWNFIVQNMWVNLVFPQIYFFCMPILKVSEVEQTSSMQTKYGNILQFIK